jgi:hypothetical protein
MSHYDDRYNKCLKHYAEHFEEHQLVEMWSYIHYMAKPGTRIMDVWVAFIGDRIVITGDAIIEGRGVISHPGYGLKWFVGELGEDYLGEKFLFTTWVEEAAKDFVDDELELIRSGELDEERGNNLARVEALQDIKNSHAWHECEYAPIWVEHAQDCEDWPPRRYDPRALAMLVAIQKRFSELYRAKKAREEP